MTLPYTQLQPRLTRWQRSSTISWKSYVNGAAGTNFPPIQGRQSICFWHGASIFAGPLQQISLGGNTVKLEESSRCLGVQLDNKLKWDTHVNELIKLYTKKLNLLRSRHILSVKLRTDFYFTVILLAVTYGLAVWRSCGSTLFTELEKIHVRAAKIISSRYYFLFSLSYVIHDHIRYAVNLLCLNKRFAVVTGRLDYGRTSHFDNEISFFQEFFYENLSPSFLLYKIWLTRLGSSD